MASDASPSYTSSAALAFVGLAAAAMGFAVGSRFGRGPPVVMKANAGCAFTVALPPAGTPPYVAAEATKVKTPQPSWKPGDLNPLPDNLKAGKMKSLDPKKLATNYNLVISSFVSFKSSFFLFVSWSIFCSP